MGITWHKPKIDFYVDLLKTGQYFSLPGFSDAEWYSILGHAHNKRTGLGQIMNRETGVLLGDVIKRRPNIPDFFLCVPDCFWEWDYFKSRGIGKKLDSWLETNNVNPTFYEREVITDRLAADGKLFSFINQLRKMPIRIIGNEHLRKINFLYCDHFTEISSPNCHMEECGIENAVEDVLSYGQPGVYLVSAGMSAALIIDKLHGQIPNSWFIDCGSIWDGFVRIGAQRKWRATLYRNDKKYQEWLNANLTGAPYERPEY